MSVEYLNHNKKIGKSINKELLLGIFTNVDIIAILILMNYLDVLISNSIIHLYYILILYYIILLLK